ncbi:hypothetical protein MTO96_001271 [Rhipicephalus appendiculatus]
MRRRTKPEPGGGEPLASPAAAVPAAIGREHLAMQRRRTFGIIAHVLPCFCKVTLMQPDAGVRGPLYRRTLTLIEMDLRLQVTSSTEQFGHDVLLLQAASLLYAQHRYAKVRFKFVSDRLLCQNSTTESHGPKYHST